MGLYGGFDEMCSKKNYFCHLKKFLTTALYNGNIAPARRKVTTVKQISPEGGRG